MRATEIVCIIDCKNRNYHNGKFYLATESSRRITYKNTAIVLSCRVEHAGG